MCVRKCVVCVVYVAHRDRACVTSDSWQFSLGGATVWLEVFCMYSVGPQNNKWTFIATFTQRTKSNIALSRDLCCEIVLCLNIINITEK